MLRTDHKPLMYIFDPKGAFPQPVAGRLQRSAVRLQGYEFQSEHVPGQENQNGYWLSRLPNTENTPSQAEAGDQHVIWSLEPEGPMKPLTPSRNTEITAEYKLLAEVTRIRMAGHKSWAQTRRTWHHFSSDGTKLPRTRDAY